MELVQSTITEEIFIVCATDILTIEVDMRCPGGSPIRGGGIDQQRSSEVAAVLHLGSCIIIIEICTSIARFRSGMIASYSAITAEGVEALAAFSSSLPRDHRRQPMLL